MLVTRSVLAGAAAGMLAAGLIFFGFGFIGLEGGGIWARVDNGWDAAVFFGLRRGPTLGIAIALGLTLALLAWSRVSAGVDSNRARPWLTAGAAVAMVVGNLRSVRAAGGWDEVALLTVAFMALVSAGAVWWVSPWVLRPLDS
ncbi:MAG: hypothetical protein ACLFWM_05735 [Actinomycetota bacterium]